MTFIVTLLLTTAVIAIALLGFYWFGVPSYRVDEKNLTALIEQTLQGIASPSDWDVLASFMIHHNDELEQLRCQLVSAAEHEMIAGSNPVRFTPLGECQLREQLAAIKRLSESS